MDTPEQNPESFNIRIRNGKKYIFDTIRRKFVFMSPEEMVRQQFIRLLIAEMDYPPERFAVEAGLRLNRLQKRTDILIYNSETQPWMIVECKAPEVAINQDVFDQALRYNYELKVSYIVVTNGKQTYTCHLNYQSKETCFLEQLPSYPL